MYDNYDFDVRVHTLMDAVTERFCALLGENLVGIYLYGVCALVYGSSEYAIDDAARNWKFEEATFIAVVSEPLCRSTKLALQRALAELAPLAPPLGIIMSVVLREHCGNFIYPTPYEFHASPSHVDPCDDTPKTDSDLLAHFTMVMHRGASWHGAEIEQVFAPIPPKQFIATFMPLLPKNTDELLQDSYHHIANLCRFAVWLKSGWFSTKEESFYAYSHRRPAHFGTLMREAFEVRDGHAQQVGRHKANQFLKWVNRDIELLLSSPEP
ncbi:MAG: DUF4111 domain-containing protein [Oscillospiraceae bacterium]|nr:DUF4111 domain-containing protein [Oscillospiraceae bacterium]